MTLLLGLLRHAKSSWDDAALDDHDRPLNARGKAAVETMGRWISSCGAIPSRIHCSTARRTRETLDILQRQWHAEVPVAFDRRLYMAEPAALLDNINGCPAGVTRLMVIAHNPGLEDLAAALAMAGDPAAIAAMRHKFPTAALAQFAFEETSWSDVRPGSGTLVSFTTPRSLAPR